MKLILQRIVLATAIVTILSCEKKPVVPVTANQQKTDVYIAGNILANNNVHMAAYWKNGTLVKLVNDSTSHSYAGDITVNGNDVYVSGSIRNTSTGDEQMVYWKNGIITKLSGVGGIIGGSYIVVNGNDVYVVGNISIPALRNNTSVPAYWKNAVAQTIKLAADDEGLDANSIAVVGNDVYISGAIKAANHNNVAAYWKNGVQTKLATTTAISYSRGLAVVGNDVYVSGYSFGNGAGYWKNGVFNRLSTDYSTIYAIAVKGSDVYIAGAKSGPENSSGYITGYLATYWKNGVVAKQIGELGGSGTVAATSIALNGDDIYVIGKFNSLPPSYWKNNALVKFTTNGIGSGIFVISK